MTHGQVTCLTLCKLNENLSGRGPEGQRSEALAGLSWCTLSKYGLNAPHQSGAAAEHGSDSQVHLRIRSVSVCQVAGYFVVQRS